MNITKLILIGFCFTGLNMASAATITVGSDSACDFTDLQSALEYAASTPRPDSIHVSRNISHEIGAINLGDDKVRIVGGFSNCSDQTSLGYTRVNVLEPLSSAGLVGDSRIERVLVQSIDVNLIAAILATDSN